MASCLALNVSYEPLALMPVKRAIRLVYQGKAEVVEHEGTAVRSAVGSMPRPTVIRLKRMVRIPRRLRRKVTNTFLFARDAYTCGYCGRTEDQLGLREALTRDHVIPQSRGGKNTWENCVTACSKCNHAKGDRTPEEVGMRLLVRPRTPDLVGLRWSVRRLTALQKKYVAMFYGDEMVTALSSNG